MLSDPTRSQVVLVTLPEETPVNELVDTAFALEDRVGRQPRAGRGQRAVPRRRPACRRCRGRRPRRRASPSPPTTERPCQAAAEFRQDRAELQREQVDRLDARLPLPQIHLPFVFTAGLGASEIVSLADDFLTGLQALAA